MLATEITVIAGILILATLTESLVEYLIAPIAEAFPEAKDWSGIVLRYIAALVGIALCSLYNADLLAMLGLVSTWPWVGWVVTGFLVGRGANFVHDFASRWLARPAN